MADITPKSARCLVIGYYDQGNLGDAMFQSCFQSLLHSIPNVDFDFVSPPQLDQWATLPPDVTHIILGAGDVMTSYFIDPLKRLVESSHFSGPIFALGVGVPFPSEMIDYALSWDANLFDEIIFRSSNDSLIGHQFLHESKVSTCADLAALLYSQTPKSSRPRPPISTAIGVNFPGDLYVNLPPEKIDHFIDQIAKYLSNLPVSNPYHLHFLNFKYGGDTADNAIHSAIASKVTSPFSIINFQNEFEAFEYIASNLDMGIGARYHFCLFLALCHVPVLPVCMTRKVFNLCNLGPYLELPTINSIPGMPLTGDVDIQDWMRITANFTAKGNSQLDLRAMVSNDPRPFIMAKLLEWFSPTFRTARTSPVARSTVIQSVSMLQNLLDSPDTKGCPNLISKLVLHTLLGTHEVDFLWGLTEKLKNPQIFDWSRELAFVWRTHCIDYFNGIVKKPHRHGWSWVLDRLQPFIAELNRDGIEFVDYVDKTFGWDYDFHTYNQSLPKNQWLGVVHHTFHTSEENNLHSVFSKPLFLSSLEKCIGLIVFTKHLESQIRQKLIEIGHPHVRTVVLPHPAPLTEHSQDFDFDAFSQNPRVFHIGKFLRNTFSIHVLESHSPKFILCGHNMDDIAPPDNVQIHGTVGRFLSELQTYISKTLSSVQKVSAVNDDEYDALLASCIVFLDLFDASAVNTIIECFVRNTPVLVNKISPVVEFLGEDYPFYYESLTEASVKVNDQSLIGATCEYLKLKSKSILDFSLFESLLREFVVSR